MKQEKDSLNQMAAMVEDGKYVCHDIVADTEKGIQTTPITVNVTVNKKQKQIKKVIFRNARTGAFEINPCDNEIFSKLITEAGRWCEEHASCILYEFEKITKCLSVYEKDETEMFVIAMHRNGIKSAAEICLIDCDNYTVWAVVIRKWEDEKLGHVATMTLARLDSIRESYAL